MRRSGQIYCRLHPPPSETSDRNAEPLVSATAPKSVDVQHATPQPTSAAALVQLAAAAGNRAAMPQAAPLPAPVAEATTSSTADKIRSPVNAAVTPQVQTDLDDATLQNAIKFATLAIIQAGIQELVTAVVADQYDIHTNYKDKDFSGRIHFAFVGHEEDQTELERLLANAAEKGIVSHSKAVMSNEASVNGHILLFDLVERALDIGTLEEQRAGVKMRRAAQALLAKDVDEPANAAGEKFHVVEAGDSLAYIALQFYGNTNDFQRIFEANRGQITTPDKILVGQRLRIPSA